MPRILKAIAALSVIWAAWFGAAGGLLSLYQSIRIRRAGFDLAPDPAVYLLIFPIWGALSGALFAALLAATERNHDVDGLSWHRVVAVGALSAILLPGAIAAIDGFSWTARDLVSVAVVATIAGCAAAAGTLYLARRGRTQSLEGVR